MQREGDSLSPRGMRRGTMPSSMRRRKRAVAELALASRVKLLIPPVPRPFLTAEWRNLVMLNFTVAPYLLEPLVPRGIVLDIWRGSAFVSLVGFLFANTRLLGVSVPAHRTFEEVNLRFYVRRQLPHEDRRGVTFIRELVPRRAIALTAKLAYNEPYLATPMRHHFGPLRADGVPDRVDYAWRGRRGWMTLACSVISPPREAAPNSEEEFITEHYWGYTRQRRGGTVEYRVEHPRWRVWDVDAALIDGDLEPIYGKEFASVLRLPPTSAFLADGSPVTVYAPTLL
jgi:uncharacterized protein YqjF (DUF2071 family)